jgi:hypothetical protein
MGNQAATRIEHLYLQDEATYGIIPNAGGTATVGNSNAALLAHFQMYNVAPVIRRVDKTGSRSLIPGARGRVHCEFNGEFDMAASGVAGTIPPMHSILRSLFGADPTIVGGTSVTYAISDVLKSFTAWSFRDATTGIAQRVGHGLVVRGFEFRLGEDAAVCTFQGMGQFMANDHDFGGYDTTEKGGLTAFPAEPGAPVLTDGGLCIGFTGHFKVGGNVIASIRTATIRGETGNELRTDTFGTFYPDGMRGGPRRISVVINAYDDSGAEMDALRAACDSKAPLTVDMQVGTVAGNIWNPVLNNVQFNSMQFRDDQINWTIDIADSDAHETTPGAKDDFTLALT